MVIFHVGFQPVCVGHLGVGGGGVGGGVGGGGGGAAAAAAALGSKSGGLA